MRTSPAPRSDLCRHGRSRSCLIADGSDQEVMTTSPLGGHMQSSMSIVDMRSDSLLDMPEVQRRLKRSRTGVYGLIRSGALTSVRCGGSRRVRESDLVKFMEGLS